MDIEPLISSSSASKQALFGVRVSFAVRSHRVQVGASGRLLKGLVWGPVPFCFRASSDVCILVLLVARL